MPFPSINYNFDVFKEPKGFIKIIQILFIIISLASICSFYGVVQLDFTCNDTKPENVSIRFSYPFNLNINNNIKVWNVSNIPINGNYESSSQFFVFISSISLIYCLCALAVYIMLNDFLYQDPKIRKTDFIIEAVLTFLWFVVAVAWSDVVVKLKGNISNLTLCGQILPSLSKHFNVTCTGSGDVPFGAGYVAIIASFTSFVLMLCGLWFLWKETAWFQKPAQESYVSNDMPRGDEAPVDRPYY